MDLSRILCPFTPAVLAFVCIGLVPVVTPQAAPASEEGPLTGPPPGGGLLVTPKRLVFDDRARRGEITLMNRGAKPITFRLELVERTMDSEGRLLPLAEGESPQTLAGLVRYSPRQIEVGPGEQQAVRVMVRRPADLPAGEYRSHLQLRALPPPDFGGQIEDFTEEDDRALSFRLKALPAISLPIIVRHGPLSASVTLETGAFDPQTTPSVPLELVRTGDRSVYGDLSATWHPTSGSQELPVGQARGVAIYTTTAQRSFDLPVRLPEGTDWESGTLVVRFDSRPEHDGGGPALSAETRIQIP